MSKTEQIQLTQSGKPILVFYRVCWFNSEKEKQFVLIEQKKLAVIVERFLIALHGREVWIENE